MAKSAALKQVQSPSLVSFPPDYFFSSINAGTETEFHSHTLKNSHYIKPTRAKDDVREQYLKFQSTPASSYSEMRSELPATSHSDGERSASEDDMDEFYALEPLEEDSLSEAEDNDLRTPSARVGASESDVHINSQQAGAAIAERRTIGAKNSSARRRRLLSFSRSPWPVADGWEVHLTPTHGPSASRHGTASGRRRAARPELHGIGEKSDESIDGVVPQGLSSVDAIRTQLARRMLPSPVPFGNGADLHASSEGAS